MKYIANLKFAIWSGLALGLVVRECGVWGAWVTVASGLALGCTCSS